MSDTQQFVADMAEAIGEAKATVKQREIAKAWLRFMVAHANRKAAERAKLTEKK